MTPIGMMETIKIEVHLFADVAVRAGKARAGYDTYTLTEAMLGQLTEEERDWLAGSISRSYPRDNPGDPFRVCLWPLALGPVADDATVLAALRALRAAQIAAAERKAAKTKEEYERIVGELLASPPGSLCDLQKAHNDPFVAAPHWRLTYGDEEAKRGSRPTLFDIAYLGFYEDISYKVVKALCDDPDVRDEFTEMLKEDRALGVPIPPELKAAVGEK